MKMYEAFKNGNMFEYMMENNHEPYIKVEEYKRGEN